MTATSTARGWLHGRRRHPPAAAAVLPAGNGGRVAACRRPALALAVGFAGAASLCLAPALGPPVGTVVVVQRTVLALAAGQPDRQLRFRDPVADGLRVRLVEKDSFLKVRFVADGEESLAGVGTYTLQGPGEAALQRGPGRDAAGHAISTLLLYLGRLRLALRPGGGEHGAEVRTPNAVLGIKGTYVRVLVDPAVGTFVAVDEGEATVQAAAGGRPVRVGAGGWVVVPPGGLPGRPGTLSPPDPHGGIIEDPPLLPCCTQTEGPKPPRR
jgi:hypothetical protein